MNIQTVAQNLRKTIAGKEMLLESYKNPSVGRKGVAGEAAMYATIQFLEANIDELKRILQDVEQCIPKEPSNPSHNADSGLYGPEYQGQ